MRNIVVLVSLIALVFGSMAVSSASTTIYGVTGLIETPNDSIAKVAMPQLAGTYAWDLLGNGRSGVSYGGAIGIMPKLEVSGVAMDTDTPGQDTQGIFNAKYRLIEETIASPSITVGVVDVTERLSRFNGRLDEVSAFIVVGKNLTQVAEDVAGSVVKPIKGTVGIGTGLYRGGFAGLSMNLTPKVDVDVEYLVKGIRDKGSFNGAVHYTPIEGLNIAAGVLHFDDFFGSVNYTMLSY